jgi:two-component system response regulator (stage 0 sporulation protein F)
MHRILLIDDDTATVRWMYRALAEWGYDVRTAVSAAQAIESALDFQPELLCTDWFLQDGIDGVEVARRLKELSPEMKVVIITGLSREDLALVVGREELPVEAILEKPIDVSVLLETLEQALGPIR